jgi:hypothetical protein
MQPNIMERIMRVLSARFMLHYRCFHAPRPRKLRVDTKYRVFRGTDIKRLQGMQGNGRFSSFAGRERQFVAMVYQEGRRDSVSVQVANYAGGYKIADTTVKTYRINT